MKRIFYILSTALVLFACTRENELNPQVPFYEGDGTLVDITLNYGADSPSVAVTKVLDDNSERQVNDIFLFAFPVAGIDQGGHPIMNNSRNVVKQYFTKDEITGAYAQEGHYNAGSVSLNNLPTGTYVFGAVANVLTAEYASESLFDALMAVNSWDDYCHVRADMTSKGSVDRIAPSLLMSGSYRPLDYEGDHRSHLPVVVSSAGQLSGYIHLVRVDARVKFVITNEIARVKSFNLENWQVFNVPNDVLVFTDSNSTPLTTSNSNVNSKFTSKDTEHSFEFYIPEYVFTSGDASLDSIRKREKRNEEDTEWVYAPENSPYVVFTGKMEMLVDDAETGEKDVNRYANAKFIVHLGTCKGDNTTQKAKDFCTDRNTKYTYNIKIRGVDDIVVEAKITPETEYNHGVEGVVIDNVGGVTYNFDSHYGIANIALSKNDLKKMSITINSVLGEQHYNRDNEGHLISSTIDIESEDFQAFRFAFEPVSSVLAYQNYPAQIFRERFVSYSKTYDAGKYIEVQHNEVSQSKDADHTCAMYDLKSMLECLPFGDGASEYADPALIAHLDAAEAYRLAHPGTNQYASKDDIPVIFTMFVNENVYYKGTQDWHHHANSVDRMLRMFTTSNISEDGKSEYIRGRYNFDQKYCQTYYSDVNNEALCVEFVNEHHHKDIKNSKGTNPGAGKSVKSGWQYVNAELQGKKWDDCSDQTMPLCEHYNAFHTLCATNGVYAKNIPGSSDANDYEAIYASLSRNRDLNRDGIINSKELKWFLASMEQYIQITIGGAALERKIFVPDDYNNWNEPVDGPKGNIFGNVRFHFCGVETQSKFWSEEGYTVGNQSVSGAAESSDGWRSNPWELLCCRMLVDHERIHEEEIHWNDFDDLYYFSDRSKNVVAMDHYRSNLHRQEITSWIDLHTNDNDVANSTFTHFQFAQRDADLVDRDPGEPALLERMHLNTYCTNYSQEEDGSDRGTWRTPNQRETAVMRYLAGIDNNTAPYTNTYYLSCSIWPFPSSGQRTKDGYREVTDFCTIGNNPTKSSPNGQLSQNDLRVRCVRDTDKDGNFVGKPEYGNPINFEAGEFVCTYNSDGTANITVLASMIPTASVSSVTIGSDAASFSGSGTVTSTVSNIEPTSSTVTVTWKILSPEGRTLTYKHKYTLPARYWTISRNGYLNRYAYVNTENGRTAVGGDDNRDVNQIEAIYKWILTTSPTETPVNVTELQTDVTYYLYNVGADAYINGYQSTSGNYLTTGANAIPVKLTTDSRYPGYYVIRLNNATNANSNGGVQNFGTWTGVDQGSTYILKPAVLRGEMPLYFHFADDYTVSGTSYSVSIETNPDAEIANVTIAGLPAVVTGSNGHYTATVNGAISGTDATLETVWNVLKDSDIYVRRHTYGRHVKYYVISSEKGPQQYAYVNSSTNRTAADATPYTGEIDNLDANHQWIFASAKANPGVEPACANVFSNLDAVYYMYNRGTGTYITGPLNNSTFGYLAVGVTAEDRMRVKVESRSNGRYSFLFSQSGINNHCITTFRENPRWTDDPAIFGVFQTSGRNNGPFRFNLLPIYE